jgi:hypothetical protein
MSRKPALTPEQAREVRDAYCDRSAKWTTAALAKCFGVSQAVINAAIERRGAYRRRPTVE